jgi:predicted nucleic acid-binding Zn ribbon protein
MKRQLNYAVLAMAMGTMLCHGVGFADCFSHSGTSRPLKRCLLCGAEHSHNNSFCSADHCREYHRQQKANKVLLPNVNQQRKAGSQSLDPNAEAALLPC